MIIGKHGFDFADLNGLLHVVDCHSVARRLVQGIGEFQVVVILAAVFKPLGSEAISVISMRPASSKERKPL